MYAPLLPAVATFGVASLLATMILARRDRRTLPVTIGLFGTWGSGKTTTLAYIARKLGADPKFNVIYGAHLGWVLSNY